MNQPEATSSWKRPAAIFGTAFAVYLALSIVLWWGVWSSHPTSTMTCPCNDPSLFVWFLEWPAYAISHGHNPFYSTALFHPSGINLLSNTSVLAIGIPLAPITWLFGPIATLNVALTLGPALTALSMFWLLRRWVRFLPAAFAGGLVFGFSPFVVTNLAIAHLMTGVLVLVPLMVACIDELLVRQKRRALVPGVWLGLLLTAQFLLSTEVLVIIAICGVASLVMLLAYAAVNDRADLINRIPHAVKGFGATAAVTAVLLAYPLWFALRGSAHLSGLIWPPLVPQFGPGTSGISLGNLWHLKFFGAAGLKLLGGYEGPALPQAEYLGVGLLVVLGVGLAAWWRDRRLWFFGALALVSIWLSLGINSHYWVPWRVLAHIPLVQNIVVTRFFAITTMCAAIMLAITVDDLYGYLERSLGPLSQLIGRHSKVEERENPRNLAGWKVLSGILALGIAVVAIVPLASSVATNIPLTTGSVVLPGWYTKVAPDLPAGQVVLAYPPPAAGGSAMVWQAVDSLSFALATGAGPGSVSERAGKERIGQDLISQAALVLSVPPPATPGNVEAVRQALAGWGVTFVVVADPELLEPQYNRVGATTWALAIFTLAIGRPPQFTDDAWVWSDVKSPDPILDMSARDYARCTSAQMFGSASRQAVPDCVLARSSGPRA